MKKLRIILGAVLLTLSLPLVSVAESKPLFEDVPSTKHFAKAVNELAARNIIGGYPDGTFKPSHSITRGQAAAIIVKLTKLDTTNVQNPKFKDVTTANGYYKAIAALAEKGIINGYGDGRFGPNDSITRAQMASILIKAFKLPLYRDPNYGFKDVVHKNGHRDGIYSLYQLGLTTGTSPTTFSPNASITRGQAAKLMKAAENVKPTILTLYAKDYLWKKFSSVSQTYSDVFDIVPASEVPSDRNLMTKIHIVPKKEGTAPLNFTMYSASIPNATNKSYRKYYVHVKKANSEWAITLEETSDVFSTPVQLSLGGDTASEEGLLGAESISLETKEGKLINDQLVFDSCDKEVMVYCHKIHIEQPGEFIATVRSKDDRIVRYFIRSTEQPSEFYYSIRKTRIIPQAEVTIKKEAQLGKPVFPKGSEEIATVTRDPGTNVFRMTPKKVGNFYIGFPNQIKGPDEYMFYYGIRVSVEKLGPYWHVDALVDQEDDMLMH